MSNTKKEVAAPSQKTDKLVLKNTFNDGMSEHFESLNSENLIEVIGEYFDFTTLGEGGQMDCIVEKIDTMNIEGKEKECVVFCNANRERFLAGATVFVNACKKLILPCAIRVTFKGEKKGAVGKYLDLSIQVPAASYQKKNA